MNAKPLGPCARRQWVWRPTSPEDFTWTLVARTMRAHSHASVGFGMSTRRFTVKGFGASGCVFAVSCKHLESAMKLFERKAEDAHPTWSLLVLMDREKWRVVRSLDLEGATE